MNSIKLI